MLNLLSLKFQYAQLATANALVAKVLRLSEIAQMGKIEKRLFQFFVVTWKKREKEAIAYAVREAKKLKSPSSISKGIDKIMRQWPKDIEDVFSVELENTYKLARNAGYKKATRQTTRSLRYGISEAGVEKAKKKKVYEILPSFSLADQSTIDALKKNQISWVGDFYEEGLSKKIADVTRKAMAEAGKGSYEAGQIMGRSLKEAFSEVEIPKGWRGTPEEYFEALSANALTVARVQGKMNSFMEIGITHYTISNPGDKRTCGRCADLDGTEFTIEQGVDQITSDLGATSKEALKSSHPWLSLTQLQSITAGKSGSARSAALAKAGQALPPYHFKCRCTVDVSERSMTVESLSPMIPPTPTSSSKKIEKTPPGQKTLTQDQTAQMLRTGNVESFRVEHELTLVEIEARDGKKVSAIWSPVEKDKRIRKDIDPKTHHKRESAFYRLDREMGAGLVTPVSINRDLGTKEGFGNLQYYDRKGVKSSAAVKRKVEGLASKGELGLTSYRRIFLLDLITANSERDRGMLYKVSKQSKYKGIASSNKLSFSPSTPSRFVFPIVDIKERFLDFGILSIKRLKGLKLKRVATILHEEGLDKKEIYNTLLRVRALQINPKIVIEQKSTEPGLKVVDFWKNIVKRPKKYIGAKEVSRILGTIDEMVKNK